MKKEKRELNVDIIGGQGSLTKPEEEAISRYLKSKKKKSKTKSSQSSAKTN